MILPIHGKHQPPEPVLVDDDDLSMVSKMRWYYSPRTGYIHTHTRIDGVRKNTMLHRFLMGNPEGMQVDHINNLTTDNQRSNLRVVTRTQNNRNRTSRKGATSKYLGVSWAKANNKWRAGISIGPKKHKNLGYYLTEEEAAEAYDLAAIEKYGEFANLNFPEKYTVVDTNDKEVRIGESSNS